MHLFQVFCSRYAPEFDQVRPGAVISAEFGTYPGTRSYVGAAQRPSGSGTLS